MRFFVDGVGGQLGFDIVRELNKRGFTDILGTTKETLDITSEEAVMQMITAYKPDIIFHCAAYTAVDQAEQNEQEAYLINVKSTEYVLNAAQKVNAKIVYVSTDYVFDGTKEGLYEIMDKTNPVSVYGKTKALGEEVIRSYPKHFIARTSWVFGIHGNNFVKTMLRLSETKKDLNVVSDQIGSPTYTVDLAHTLVSIALSENYGTYHVNNNGFCSWAEFAAFIFAQTKKSTEVHPIPTSEYQTPAKRPLNSRLSKKSLTDNGFSLLPSWENATERYIEELEKEKVLIK